MQKIFTLITAALFLLFLSIAEFRQSSPPTTPTSINMVSFPQEAFVKTPLNLSWELDSMPSKALSTAIYYDYQSTPSAVTIQDDPKALGYRFHTQDYAAGHFPVPGVYDVNIIPTSTGMLFFRAYALLNGEHLWTKEYSIKIK